MILYRFFQPVSNSLLFWGACRGGEFARLGTEVIEPYEIMDQSRPPFPSTRTWRNTTPTVPDFPRNTPKRGLPGWTLIRRFDDNPAIVAEIVGAVVCHFTNHMITTPCGAAWDIHRSNTRIAAFDVDVSRAYVGLNPPIEC